MDVAHGCKRGFAVELLIDVLANAFVFNEQFAVKSLGGIPAAAVSFGDANSESKWINLLVEVSFWFTSHQQQW
jgi:hypothetical protein